MKLSSKSYFILLVGNLLVAFGFYIIITQQSITFLLAALSMLLGTVLVLASLYKLIIESRLKGLLSDLSDLSAGKPVVVKPRYNRSIFDGVVENFNPNLNPIIINISKLKASLEDASHKLSALEDHLKTITDNIAAAVVLRDENHKVTYCSPYTEVLTGYSTREILSSQEDFFASIVPKEELDNYQRAFKIGALGDAFQVRHRVIHSSGIEIWVETRTVPILDDQGEFSKSLSVTVDITGAVRYQKQVEEKNKDLQDFSYMVSHDLKGPIVTIKGMLGILEEDLKEHLSGESKETLDHIKTASSRLEQLVAGILEYSKISAQDERSEKVNLEAVIEEVTHHLEPLLKPIQANILRKTKLPNVIGEHVWLYQIFSNLLSNAIKFRETTRPLEIEISENSSTHSKEVTIVVKDNGLGIPKDRIEHIFRPFQRAHTRTVEGRAIEGTGIGLASVKRMLEKCGGSVKVESKEGAGSTFFVTLRLA